MKYLLISFVVCLSNFALAYEYSYEYDVVQVKCVGKVDNFIVNLTAVMFPKNMAVIKSTVELNYKVQTWTSAPKNEFELSTSKVTSQYMAVEASVEGNQTKYKIEMPDWNDFYWLQKTSSFTTKLTLKAGLVDNNMNVDCQASLEKAQFKTEYVY
jgi:hypothetical protein